MSSVDIKSGLVGLHPDTRASEWKRRTRNAIPGGIERIFEHRDGRMVRTIEDADGAVTMTVHETPRSKLDQAINDTFRQPLVEGEGYDSWKDFNEDYQIAHAGEILTNAMITGAGPVPDAFYQKLLPGDHGLESIYDNLHSLADVEYVESNGVAGYEMEADRSGVSPRIRVTLHEGAFVLEILPD